jgi:hypothetical protein
VSEHERNFIASAVLDPTHIDTIGEQLSGDDFADQELGQFFEENSWILFDSHLIEEPKLQNVVVSTYGDFNGKLNAINGIDDTSENNLLALDDREYEQTIAATAPHQHWVWKGRAHRLGHPIPAMGKIEVGGKEATPIGTPRIMHRLLGYLFCWPLYECVWNIGLVVLDDPPEVPEPEERGPDDPDYVPGGWGQDD